MSSDELHNLPTAENGPPVEVAAALARVPTCGWHHGQYPDLCWWCGLNRVRVLPPAEGYPDMPCEDCEQGLSSCCIPPSEGGAS